MKLLAISFSIVKFSVKQFCRSGSREDKKSRLLLNETKIVLIILICNTQGVLFTKKRFHGEIYRKN